MSKVCISLMFALSFFASAAEPSQQPTAVVKAVSAVSSQCNPADCDLKDCDLSKCDPSDCNKKDCDPTDCPLPCKSATPANCAKVCADMKGKQVQAAQQKVCSKLKPEVKAACHKETR